MKLGLILVVIIVFLLMKYGDIISDFRRANRIKKEIEELEQQHLAKLRKDTPK